MQKIFNIDAFPTGYYMCWFVTTQAAYLVHVKLFDSVTTYFDASKQSIEIEPPLAQNAAGIAGANVQLLIDIPESSGIDNSLDAFEITNNVGATVGYGYNLFIEDGGDGDYNDVSIMLVAWKSKN